MPPRRLATQPPAASGHRRRGAATSRSTALALVLAVLIGVVGTGCSAKELAIRSLMLANQERHRRGVSPLLWDDEAAAKAEAWASHLAATGELEHSSLADGIATDWTALGENVGYGETVENVHSGFMGSSSHRSTLLAGKYHRAGVGVARGDGVIFVVQVFRD